MNIIFQKELSNKIIGPGLIYLFISILFIVLFIFVLIIGLLPPSGIIFILALLVLTLSIITLIISIVIIITTQPFIISDQGIQYVTKQIIPYRNYKNNFIAYSQIKSVTIFVHPIGDIILIKNYNGWVYEIPLECICKKVGKEKWIRVAPIDEMIKLWSGGKDVNLENKTTLRGDRSIYTISETAGKEKKETKKSIALIWKILLVFGLICQLFIFLVLLHLINTLGEITLVNIVIGLLISFFSSLLVMTTTYFSFKNDRRMEHFFR